MLRKVRILRLCVSVFQLRNVTPGDGLEIGEVRQVRLVLELLELLDGQPGVRDHAVITLFVDTADPAFETIFELLTQSDIVRGLLDRESLLGDVLLVRRG